MAGALAASHRNRVYDAIILKTLGATRGKLIAACGLEYTLLGLATGLFGVAARLGRCMAGGHAGHEPVICVADNSGAACRRWSLSPYTVIFGLAGTFYSTRTEAGDGSAKPVSATFSRVDGSKLRRWRQIIFTPIVVALRVSFVGKRDAPWRGVVGDKSLGDNNKEFDDVGL